jgi:hypothetical protein
MPVLIMRIADNKTGSCDSACFIVDGLSQLKTSEHAGFQFRVFMLVSVLVLPVT